MPEAPDIVIAGGGPVGLTLARALAQAGVAVRVVRAPGTAADRPIALSHASRLLLERLGAWRGLNATPIKSIHVSQRGGFGHTVMHHDDYGLPALGYVAAYSDLVPALADALAPEPLSGAVNGWEHQGDRIAVSVSSESGMHILSARLLVVAEGALPADNAQSAPAARGPASSDARPVSPVMRRDYGQSAVVATVKTEAAPDGRAWERFTAHGPLALLPFGDRYALVWSARPDEAASLAALPTAAFLARLADAFGRRLGAFLDAGARSVFPLELSVREPAPGARVLAVGNAAQTLHPVAGQGLNLGLRDAWELAELARAETPASLGTAQFVTRYLRRRRLDRRGSINATDLFARVFASNDPVARCARGFGLLALDILPPARAFLARRMMFGARALP